MTLISPVCNDDNDLLDERPEHLNTWAGYYGDVYPSGTFGLVTPAESSVELPVLSTGKDFPENQRARAGGKLSLPPLYKDPTPPDLLVMRPGSTKLPPCISQYRETCVGLALRFTMHLNTLTITLAKLYLQYRLFSPNTATETHIVGCLASWTSELDVIA